MRDGEDKFTPGPDDQETGMTAESPGGTKNALRGPDGTSLESGTSLQKHRRAASEEDLLAPDSFLSPEEEGFFCPERPRAARPSNIRAIRDFCNWAQANSVFIMAYGTGCGAIEMRPLFTARYDISRYGFFPRPTPRMSGLFIIGGYASIKTIKRIVRSYEQMQNPKFVMGLGSCTVNGGMYWDSYNTIKRLDHYIPVDVYVSGCMPRPESIIAGFRKLKELIKAGKAEGANRYAENFEWYKRNQRRIIKDWNMPEYNW